VIQRIKQPLIGLLAIGVAIYLFADGETEVHQGPDAAAVSARAVKRVKVAAVETARDRRELSFSGVVRSARRARLAFSIGGRLVARPVEEGDRVSAGQVLARLDEREIGNAVATAGAAVAELAARRAQSERDRDRAEQLLAAKAATREELEKTAAAVDAVSAAEEAAAARLREAERLLEETALRAPFAGTVTEVHHEPGEFAIAGRPVVTLSGDGELELEVEVPESVIPRVSVGDDAALYLPALGASEILGRVKSLGRTAAGPGRLFPVVVGLPADPEGPAAGMTAELVLRLTSDDALAVPVEAVVNPGGRRPSVFRLVEAGGAETVEKVAVEVGSLLGERVTVRGTGSPDGGSPDGAGGGELAAGDLVVVGGQRGLLDGEAVEAER
jgi:RND family efflux transporter MFP subunit